MKKILITATKALLYFVGWTLLVSFIPVPDFENPAIWRFAAELIPFLCIIGISILFWLIEKRSVKIFSLFNPIRNCLIGIVSGIAWLGLSFFLYYVIIWRIKNNTGQPCFYAMAMDFIRFH